MLLRDCVHSEWCTFGIVSFGIVSVRDCPFGIVFIRNGVHSEWSPFGMVFIRDCVHSGLCPFGMVSIRDRIHWGLCTRSLFHLFSRAVEHNVDCNRTSFISCIAGCDGLLQTQSFYVVMNIKLNSFLGAVKV